MHIYVSVYVILNICNIYLLYVNTYTTTQDHDGFNLKESLFTKSQCLGPGSDTWEDSVNKNSSGLSKKWEKRSPQEERDRGLSSGI